TPVFTTGASQVEIGKPRVANTGLLRILLRPECRAVRALHLEMRLIEPASWSGAARRLSDRRLVLAFLGGVMTEGRERRTRKTGAIAGLACSPRRATLPPGPRPTGCVRR